MAYIPIPNQSVSGTVGASIIGIAPVTQAGPWVSSVFGNVSVIGTVPVTQASQWFVSGSVISLQQGSVAAVIIGGSIAASFTPPANQSVSGTVGASVVGHAPVVIVGGSIAASFTPPANQSVSGTVQTDVRGSIAAVIIGGSIAASFVPPANQSVSGTVGASVVGHAPVFIIGGSIAASFTPPANQSVSGTVQSEQIGTRITSVISSNPSSMLVGASIIGLTPVSISNFPATQNVSGSVAAFQGTSPWVVNFQNSSVLAVPVGSIVATIQTPSIVGTYSEDAAHTTADRGLFVLKVRNDTVASFASADLDYAPGAVDAAGRTINKPFAAEEARVEGYASVVSTSVTTLVAAAGAGLKNYITDFFIANTGNTTTLVTFKDGLGSILGYTIAPAGGGSNGTNISTPIRTGVNTTFDFQPTSASSILYATVKGFKAP